jgi:hypothetical protein
MVHNLDDNMNLGADNIDDAGQNVPDISGGDSN